MSRRPGSSARPAATDGEPVEGAYQLLGIEPTKAPDDSGGRDWFAYRITQGENLIRGCRRGSLATVTAEVKQLVVSLNERRMVRRGRVDLVPPAKPVSAPEPTPEASSDAG